MKNTLHIYILLFLTTIPLVKGQDFHLSQYDAASLYFNPAMTGMNISPDDAFRVTGLHRSQWRVLNKKPFTSNYFSYEMPYKKFGLGGYVINNRALAGGFNTFNFLLSGAYNVITDDSVKHHNLSMGFQIGMFSKSINNDIFLFDNQYSVASSTFDSNLPSGENYNSQNIFRLDANVGLFYKYRDENKKINPFAGISLFHLSRSDESFVGVKSRVPMRWVMNAGSDIRINSKIKISPNVLFMAQGKATDLYGGVLGYYALNGTYEVLVGGGYRNQDAFIVHAGIKQFNNIFRISYDVNSSYLNTFTKGRGAFEFSIIYNVKKSLVNKIVRK